jgi:hypothetical protein
MSKPNDCHEERGLSPDNTQVTATQRSSPTKENRCTWWRWFYDKRESLRQPVSDCTMALGIPIDRRRANMRMDRTRGVARFEFDVSKSETIIREPFAGYEFLNFNKL